MRFFCNEIRFQPVYNNVHENNCFCMAGAVKNVI